MLKAKKVKQLSFEMRDRAGLLFEITTALARAKVNLSAICAYAMENKAYFMLNADNNARAKKALLSLRVKLEEEDLVSVEMPNRAGELNKVAKRIADAGINIFYMYGIASAGKSSVCVFSTSDDKKAIKVINK